MQARSFTVLAVFTLVAACGAALPDSDSHPALGEVAESCRGWRMEQGHVGESLEIPEPGKVTVLDFWSTSCEPCIAAMPEFERLWNTVDRDRVVVIGVSVDEDDALTRRFMAEQFPVQVTFPMVYDGKVRRLQGIYRVGGTVPATFVVDGRGVIRGYFDGTESDMQRLERLVNRLVRESR